MVVGCDIRVAACCCVTCWCDDVMLCLLHCDWQTIQKDLVRVDFKKYVLTGGHGGICTKLASYCQILKYICLWMWEYFLPQYCGCMCSKKVWKIIDEKDYIVFYTVELNRIVWWNCDSCFRVWFSLFIIRYNESNRGSTQKCRRRTGNG